jgi:hypothetical protein
MLSEVIEETTVRHSGIAVRENIYRLATLLIYA